MMPFLYGFTGLAPFLQAGPGLDFLFFIHIRV